MDTSEQDVMRWAKALESPVFQDKALQDKLRKANASMARLSAMLQDLEQGKVLDPETGSEFTLEGWLEEEVATPEVEQQLYEQAMEALSSEQFERSSEAFSTLLSINPLDADYLFGFALSLQFMGAIEKAAEYFSMSYALDPSNGACAFRLGECLLALGHEEDAREALRTAVQLDAVPGSDPEVRELAQQLLDQIL